MIEMATSRSKETFKNFEENAKDLLVPDDDVDSSIEDRKVGEEIYNTYMDLLKIAKNLHKKKFHSLCFLLMYIMTAIHHGPDDVDDILNFMMQYYQHKIDTEDPKYINAFDENGNRLKIEDLDKL
jgi:hypothetical protein